MARRKGVDRAFIVLCILGVIVWTVTMSEASVFAEDNAVRVISMNASEVIVEVTLPQFTTKTVQGPDGLSYARISIPGWAMTARPGYPELPVKRVLLQAPAQGTADVKVLEDVWESMPESRIYPVPQQYLSDDREPVTAFFNNPVACSGAQFYPEMPAILAQPSVLRGTSVVPLDIHPFQWNASTGELKYHTRMRIAVQWGGPEAVPAANVSRVPSREKGFGSVKQRSLINYTPLSAMSRAQASTAGLEPADLVEALRIEILKQGIYSLTYEDMAGAGMPLGIDPKTFRLLNGGTEVAIQVSSVGDNFGPGDSILFFGEGIDNPYTGTNVYFLYWGQAKGQRMGVVDGTVTDQGSPVNAVEDTLHVEQNLTLWEGTPGAPATDFWFWEKSTAPKQSDYAVTIPSPDSGTAQASVKVAFQGRSTASPHPNHHTVIYLNGTEIGNGWWDGDASHVQEMTVPQALLANGPNTLRIKLPGDTGASVDVVYFNWVEFTYKRLLQTADNAIRFTVSGNGLIEVNVSGFSSPEILALDITDPTHANVVAGITIASAGSTFKARFDAQVKGVKTYYVMTESQVSVPGSLALWQSKGLESPANGADWIVVTGQSMISAVTPLAQLRQAQGLRVKVVGMDDIYNEFNSGLADPKALKSFLQYAYDYWTPPAPTYVFLLGDANTDYRDYFGTGKKNVVPPHLCHTTLGVTPEDNWYACMDGPDDVLPDMFVGRMPANDPTMAAAIVNKIVEFENGKWPSQERVLMVADNNEKTFQALNESLVSYLPSGYGVDTVYLSDYANVADATSDIVSYMDGGEVITNYVGHGSVTNWAGEYLFESGDVSSLSNPDRLSFVIAMTCLNGYFAQPFYYCLAEEFVAAQKRGAIAGFAPSGLGYVWEHAILDTAIFSNLFQGGETVIGPAAIGAKTAAYAKGATQDLMRMFTLFGDPAIQLKISSKGSPEPGTPGGNPALPGTPGGSVPVPGTPGGGLPLPDIRVAGSDGPVWVSPSKAVEITVALSSGNVSNQVCDWWVSAGTPMGTYWLGPNLAWSHSFSPVSFGASDLFDFPSTPILDTALPVGIYTFAFFLDADPDGAMKGMEWYDYLNVVSGDGPSPVLDVLPDVKVNGQDAELVTASTQPVSVTVALDPGSQKGLNCDWWVGAFTPFGTFWYDVASGWQVSEMPKVTVTAGLLSVADGELLNGPLPFGVYTFFFILDQNPNGLLDDISWYNLANVVCQ